MFKKYICFILLFLACLVFHACDQNFLIGEEYIESQTEICVIDTFAVKLSTLRYDTLYTNATASMLLGHYRDDFFGDIQSTSYFQVGISDDYDILQDDTYDSLNLVLEYTGYWFGDTTQTLKVDVHLLTETIEYADNQLLNSKSTFAYDPQAIGSLTFTPEPTNTFDTLSIKLSDDVGRDLFNRMLDDADELSNQENFFNLIPGIVLVADETHSGVIIGLNGSEAAANIVLHSSRTGTTTESIVNEFALYNAVKQFNQIHHDYQHTAFHSLSEQCTALPAEETNGLAYLQAGTGLAIKLEFPSLPELLLKERGEIVQAELDIAPFTTGLSDFELPTQITLYSLDDQNHILDHEVSLAVSELQLDELYGENTTYRFDLTSIMIDEFDDSFVDSKRAYALAFSNSQMQTRFDRLLLDADNKNTMLKIHYLSY